MSDIAGAAVSTEAPQRNPKRWWILVVLCLSSLVLVIDNMVLNVAIPQISTELGATSQDIQWIIDAYILVFAGLLLTSGSLSDRFGRRLVMVVGLVVFGVASMLAAYADTPQLLIAGRVLMGVGGALIMPSTLSILITVFDEQERPKAIASWSAVAMVGMVGGPIVGGVLLEHFWWGSVFVLNVPIAIVAIAAALLLMPESKGPWTKPDLSGMALSIVGTTALVWTIIEWPTAGFDGTWGALLIAVAGLAAFVVRELRAEYPMVPLQLFRNRVFTGSSFSLVLVTFANGGLLLVLTQYLQFVLDYSPMRTALAFTPFALTALVFNGIGAGLVQKAGVRPVMLVGMAVLAGGFVMLSLLTTDSGFWKPALAMTLVGAGAGLAMPAAIGALMSAIPPERAGVGSALNDTIQQTGGALGVAVLGAVLAGTYTEEMPATAPAAARESIAPALTSGDGMLITAAKDAFTTAMSATFLGGAASVLAATVIAFFLMRGAKAAGGEGGPVETSEQEDAPGGGDDDLVTSG
ncbi:MFS transporter [Nocardia otitidiscaviarum]|uniref:MFS transporter n=1 Tax=Nocardia otitidiscaviarum TaxID=1823 RepID=A0A516NTZ0_9NOCA|nr:MFS transporter [Nocardia otitidiscaviarum]MCP9621678.1 MFS transporter [Nocardia otitidiscaviarum]QDP82331.1 MFS transporter [Nocardia otitidiscaviarum]